MSKNALFDIPYWPCPFCGSRHRVERITFNSYRFTCYVAEKEMFIAINNSGRPQSRYAEDYWRKLGIL